MYDGPSLGLNQSLGLDVPLMSMRSHRKWMRTPSNALTSSLLKKTILNQQALTRTSWLRCFRWHRILLLLKKSKNEQTMTTGNSNCARRLFKQSRIQIKKKTARVTLTFLTALDCPSTSLTSTRFSSSSKLTYNSVEKERESMQALYLSKSSCTCS